MNANVLSTQGDITRRALLERAAATGLATAIAAAWPLARDVPLARAGDPPLTDGTLQAVFDTLIPGRKVSATVSGAPVHPQAILGLDPDPGAVECDALALANHPKIGFSALAPVFLADLAVKGGAGFLDLDRAGRERVMIAGCAYDNPTRLIWEATAAVAFAAFCGVASVQQDPAHAPGYRVMGVPGAAPRGYRNASYRRRLARERTRNGNLR